MDQTSSPFEGIPSDLAKVALAFEDLGSLLEASDLGPYDALVRVTVDRVPGAHAASITTLRRGTFETVATTDESALRADAIQYELGSGPCVDAIIDQALYQPRDLSSDERWPEFGRRAHDELGWSSMLSYRLQLDPELAIGGLNIYSREVDAFDDEAAMVGLLLATHGSMAVNAALSQEKVTNLQSALETNREIGTAIGILMSQHRVTRQQAFNLLAVASQQTNRKLRDVAEDVIATGALEPGP
jgi:ANTAR domain